MQEAVRDGYKRLLASSVERDIRNQLTENGEKQAISVFSKNLRQLLLQPPVKGKTVLGIDPAYRTGCKWSVLMLQVNCWRLGSFILPRLTKNTRGQPRDKAHQ
ncbi:hypothetical protein N752_06485 [Desulforamulus aquiferis]|nr:hypothetical protein N752_06485 [Desulforamulus aquiferis]